MKKKNKRIISFALVIGLLLSSQTLLYEQELLYLKGNHQTAVSFTVNEYDMLMNERQQSETYLLNSGYSQLDIADSRTFAIEQELYNRAQFGVDTLKTIYGYTEHQISILKQYDGQDLKDYPQMRALASTLSGTITSPNHSTQSITAEFMYE